MDEISEVLGDRDFVTAEDIEQLQYMEQVRILACVTNCGEILSRWGQIFFSL